MVRNPIWDCPVPAQLGVEALWGFWGLAALPSLPGASPIPACASHVPCVPQVQQLLSRYLALGGSLTGPLLQEIKGRRLCNLQEEQIQQIPAAAIG